MKPSIDSTMSRRGITAVELLFVLLSAVAMAAVIVPSLQAITRVDNEASDAAQQRTIHQSMLVWSNVNGGRLPTPGWVDRLPDPDLGDVPGHGDEDLSVNHTALLYSVMIAMQLLKPGDVISPVESNRLVHAKGDYDHAQYNPSRDSYWDPTFVVYLDDVVRGSNASYAHLELTGDRKTVHWRNDARATTPILSNRGPRDGAIEGEEFVRSPTLRFLKPLDRWRGNITFGDGHVEARNGFVDAASGDNSFRNQPEREGDDVYLGVFLGNDGEQCEPVWDPLMRDVDE